MWLLNVETLCLEEFLAASKPKYAIFSHTWSAEEVTFKDIQSLDFAQLALFWDVIESPGISHVGEGLHKVLNCCRIAYSQGYQHVWIDTCCINKESSAELSEAINSMYKWYESSEVCYVHLADLTLTPDDPMRPSEGPWIQNLSSCRWFFRGWTLQELIAPTKVEFYNADWQYVSSKHDIIDALATITRIDRVVLGVEKNHKARLLREFSVACKLSWASRRKTTRVEDEAYALLGLFEINMPLLYGEGKKAFRRLQGIIISTSADHSALLWNWRTSRISGLLAPSPEFFSDCGRIVPCKQQDNLNTSISITKEGIRLICPVVEVNERMGFAVLNCRYEDDLSGPILLTFTHTNAKNLDEDLVVFRELASDSAGTMHNFVTWDAISGSMDSSYLSDHDLGTVRRLLLADENRLQGLDRCFDSVLNRVSVVFDFRQEFDRVFEPHSWNGRYNRKTNTLVWNSGSWFTPTEGSITWLGPAANGVRLVLKRTPWLGSNRLALAASFIPGLSPRKEPNLERCTVITSWGVVAFEVRTQERWGEVVHFVTVSMSPFGTPTAGKET